MPDYKKLYHIMFNAATDALASLDAGDAAAAARLLRFAQCKAEDVFIGDECESRADAAPRSDRKKA